MSDTTHDIAGLVEDRPYAWVIPGDDYADMNGFIYARITEEGEFTKPLYDTAAITALQAERDEWKARAEAAEAACRKAHDARDAAVARAGATWGENTNALTQADRAWLVAHLSYELVPVGKPPTWNQLAMEVIRQGNEIAALTEGTSK